VLKSPLASNTLLVYRDWHGSRGLSPQLAKACITTWDACANLLSYCLLCHL
jgi:hypothetical protein